MRHVLPILVAAFLAGLGMAWASELPEGLVLGYGRELELSRVVLGKELSGLVQVCVEVVGEQPQTVCVPLSEVRAGMAQ